MESNEDGQTCSVTSDLLQPFISLCRQVSIMLVYKTTVQASHGFQKGVPFGWEKFDPLQMRRLSGNGPLTKCNI